MADKKKAPDEDDIEEGQAESSSEETAAPKKSKKKLIIIVAVVLLLGIAAGVAFFSDIFTPTVKMDTTKKDKKKKKEGGEEAAHGTTGSSAKAVKVNPNEWVPGIVPGHEADDIAYYNLPEFIVNLNTGGKQTSFVKMKVTLDLPSTSDGDAVDNRLPRIIDSFNTYLRELRTSDIAGSTGLYRLREELLLRVNKTIYPSKVNDILFREIIIQ